MRSSVLPSLKGPLVYIASDYSGTHKKSKYFVISILLADIYNSYDWEYSRRKIREKLLPDNRRMCFKSIANDRYRRNALVPFLQAASSVEGLLASFIIRKSVKRLVTFPGLLDKWYDQLGLNGKWTEKQFENMLRIANFVSILIGAMGKTKQSIYWISDEDEIFANSSKQKDVALMMSRLSSLYIKHQPGELGVGTTTIDPGDRVEEDLVAVSDLAAGALAEIVQNLSKHPNYYKGKAAAIPTGLKPKTSLIYDWLCSSSKLKRTTIIFDKSNKGNFSVRKLEFEQSRIII